MLIRLLFLALCAVLILSTWWTYTSVTVSFLEHDTFYTQVHPWLRPVRQWSLFGVLIFCVLVARRDPLFTRIGLLTVVASLTIMLVPPREIHQTVTKLEGIKFDAHR